MSYSSQKSSVKIWFGLVEIGGMLIFRGAEAPIRGYMWPAIPIFELVRAIPVKSHVWKFGWNWLSLSRVIVSTDKKKKMNFPGGGGQKSPLGGLHLTFDAHFELGWAIPVKSHVWKFGLDWFKSEVCKISGGQKPPIKGSHMWPVMPIFVHGRAISVKRLVWKFGWDWLSLSRVIVVTDKKKNNNNNWIFRGAEIPY